MVRRARIDGNRRNGKACFPFPVRGDVLLWMGILVLVTLTGCGGGGSAGSAPRQPPLTGGAYTLIDLGTIGDESVPRRINAQNQVIGTISRTVTVEGIPSSLHIDNKRSYSGVFLYRPGATLAQGELQDVTPTGYRSIKRSLTPTAFNNAGRAVGIVTTIADNPVSIVSVAVNTACAWDVTGGSGARVTLLPQQGSASPLAAEDISNAGHIVGQDTPHAAFHYGNGGYIPQSLPGSGAILGSYYNQLYLYSVNDRGDAAGIYSFSEGEFIPMRDHAVISRGGALTDLGVPEGTNNSIARRISSEGAVIGEAWNGMNSPPYRLNHQAFLWRNGKFTTLPGMDGYELSPLGINAGNVVVGNARAIFYPGSGVTPLPQDTGFLWREGTTVDINTQIKPGSDWWITQVTDINDAGIMCATAKFRNGKPRVVLLVPR